MPGLSLKFQLRELGLQQVFSPPVGAITALSRAGAVLFVIFQALYGSDMLNQTQIR
jgi:hypothetical protein